MVNIETIKNKANILGLATAEVCGTDAIVVYQKDGTYTLCISGLKLNVDCKYIIRKADEIICLMETLNADEID